MGDVIPGFGPSTILKGFPYPNCIKQSVKFNPTTGYIGEYEFDGASQKAMLVLFNKYVASGCSPEITYADDVATMHVEDPTFEFVLDTWEIAGNAISMDGLSNPNLASVLGSQPNDYYAYLRQQLENDGKPSEVGGYFSKTLHFSDPATATVQQFYQLQQAGSAEFESNNYVLRHSTNVSNQYQTNVADFGVDTIYSPAQLLTEASDSALWLLPLPPRLIYKLAVIPVPAPQANYLWGWLKSSSTENNAANNRVDIKTDYKLALWSIAPNGYYNPFNGIFA